MSVIVKHTIDKTNKAFVKGSPEKIEELCIKASLPKDYHEVLEIYTRKGYRVIALAFRPLPNMNYIKIQKLNREEIETDLHFLGFLIMENKLKEVTSSVIANLKDCKIRTIMATGDNTLTAISVAKGCNILRPNQNVYFCDVEDNQLVWKLSKGEES